jgi:hypothetical protein
MLEHIFRNLILSLSKDEAAQQTNLVLPRVDD